MNKKELALKKALLLAKANIRLHPEIDKRKLEISRGNIGRNQWIFIRISETSRVRLVLSEDASLLLVKSGEDTYNIQDLDTNEIILNNVTLERILSHAPEQLFFLLYRNCCNMCRFCPMTYITVKNDHSSWEEMHRKISENEKFNIRSISVTTGSPHNKTQEELVEEMVDSAKKIRKIKGNDIPIGMSLKTPTQDQLQRLKEAGVSEMRLNLETYNLELARTLMPVKEIDKILQSIEHAVEIFGKEKVSSNMIIGLGETDNDILRGVEVLSEIGSLSTLYPYDPISQLNGEFKRPSAERIFRLAVEHKKILEKYKLNPLGAETMCCSCAASHLYPGRDI